jgi:hypothetical protein
MNIITIMKREVSQLVQRNDRHPGESLIAYSQRKSKEMRSPGYVPPPKQAVTVDRGASRALINVRQELVALRAMEVFLGNKLTATHDYTRAVNNLKTTDNVTEKLYKEYKNLLAGLQLANRRLGDIQRHIMDLTTVSKRSHVLNGHVKLHPEGLRELNNLAHTLETRRRDRSNAEAQIRAIELKIDSVDKSIINSRQVSSSVMSSMDPNIKHVHEQMLKLRNTITEKEKIEGRIISDIEGVTEDLGSSLFLKSMG